MRKEPIIVTGVTQNDPSEQPPRLMIQHLAIGVMLAIVITLFFYSTGSVSLSETTDLGRQFGMMQRAGALLAGAMTAACFLGTGILLNAKKRGRLFPLQPGHWFLFVGSAICLCRLLQCCFRFEDEIYRMIVGVVFAIAGIGFVVKAIRGDDTLPWTFVFGLLAGMLLIPVVMFIDFLMILLLGCFGLEWIALPVAIYVDRRDRISRDDLHWLGVGVFIAGILFVCGMAVLPMLHIR